MSNQIILPRILQIGAGASQEIADILASINCHRPMITTDKMMVELDYVKEIIKSLALKKIPCDVFDQTVPEPTVSSIMAGVKQVRDGKSAAPEKSADCARAIGVANEQNTTDNANLKLLQELSALNEELEVPTPVEFGTEQTKFFSLLGEMEEQAINSGSPNNNPRIPSKDEIIEIYKKLWN